MADVGEDPEVLFRWTTPENQAFITAVRACLRDDHGIDTGSKDGDREELELMGDVRMLRFLEG